MFKYFYWKLSVCWLLLISFTLASCVWYRPDPKMEKTYLKRLVSQEDGSVKVGVAALSDQESARFFGAHVSRHGVQPVWLEMQNQESTPYILRQRSIDPDYYTPLEAAYTSHYSANRRFLIFGLMGVLCWPLLAVAGTEYISARFANSKMNRYFSSHGLSSNILMPNETASGFIFTPLDEGTKKVFIELYGEKANKTFTFFVDVPGLKFDYLKKCFDEAYPPEKAQNLTAETLKTVVEGLPCCATNKKGIENADPLNLIVVGDLNDLLFSFAAAHWDQTEVLTFKSAEEMAKSYLLGREDRFAPFSPLYYDGRKQDVGFQKARDTVNDRLHFRLWRTPWRYETKPVWVGQVSRDIGVKFTLKAWNLTTHKIDPNIDDARDYVLTDLMDAGRVLKYGYLKGVGAVSQKNPHKNLTGDPYFTDGLRIVIELGRDSETPATFDWPFPVRIPDKIS